MRRRRASVLTLCVALAVAAVGPLAAQEGSVDQTLELHFQEGFFDEPVEVRVDGREAVSFDATTRLQTGLAAIHSIEARTGGTLTVLLPARGLSAEAHIARGIHYITVNLQDGSLVLRPTDASPGYL